MIPHPPSHPLQAQPPAEGVRLFLGELGYQSSTPPEGGQLPGGGEGQQSVSAPLPRSGLAAHKAGGGKASGKAGGGKGGGGKGGGGKGGGGTGGGKGGGPKPTQAGSMLLRNYDLDEASSQPYQEQIRDALSKNAVRVIDLFREWDDNGDGTVSKKEFRRAVPMLGLDPVPSKADIDALFDQWDPDGSGNIDYKELNKILRKSAEGLDASLQAGGAGTIEMDSKAKTALRKGPNLQRGSSLAKVDIDEDSDKSVAEQLRTILSKNAVRHSKHSHSKYSYSEMWLRW